MLSEEQERLIETYNSKFGVTFSYWAIAQDEDKLQHLLVLVKDAVDGKRGAVTDADMGIDSTRDDVLL